MASAQNTIEITYSCEDVSVLCSVQHTISYTVFCNQWFFK